MTISIAVALADHQRRERAKGHATWRDPAALGQSLGLAKSTVRSEVDLAERLGLIDRKRLKVGQRVALTDLGWKLFGLDQVGPRSRIPAPTLDLDQTLEPRPPLIQLLIDWRVAVPLVEELATHLGQDPEPLWDEVLGLETQGLVETWPDHPAGPAVMLSSLTADALGLRLSTDGTRWLRPGEPDPTSIDPDLGLVTETDWSQDQDLLGLLDQTPDPSLLGGPEAALAAEAAERQCLDLLDQWTDPDPEAQAPVVLDHEPDLKDRWRAASQEQPTVFLPAPRLLLGQSLPWPVLVPGREQHWHPGSGPCPGCREQFLGVRTYCLVCCRSGLDDLLAHLLRLETRRQVPMVRRPEPGPKPTKGATRRHVRAVKTPGLRGGLGS